MLAPGWIVPLVEIGSGTLLPSWRGALLRESSSDDLFAGVDLLGFSIVVLSSVGRTVGSSAVRSSP